VVGKKGRMENGLVELTKKFIKLMRKQENSAINLNDAVRILKV